MLARWQGCKLPSVGVCIPAACTPGPPTCADAVPPPHRSSQCLEVGSWELTDVQLERAAGQPPPPRPPARHSHVSGAFEQRGLLVCGGTGLRGPMGDVWLFEPELRQWRCLSAALRDGEGPEAREMVRGCPAPGCCLLVLRH